MYKSNETEKDDSNIKFAEAVVINTISEKCWTKFISSTVLANISV